MKQDSEETGLLGAKRGGRRSLLVLLLFLLLVRNVEVAQLVAIARVGDDAQPVAQRILLEEALREVLEVALRLRLLARDRNTVLLARDGHCALEAHRVLEGALLAALLPVLLQVPLLCLHNDNQIVKRPNFVLSKRPSKCKIL